MLNRAERAPPRRPTEAAQIRDLTAAAIKRSGMREDDKARPALDVVVDAVCESLDARKLATRAIRAVCNGADPVAPAHPDARCAALNRRFAAAVVGSGLEHDVVYVFLVAALECSLAQIRDSYRLHFIANSFATYRRAELQQARPDVTSANVVDDGADSSWPTTQQWSPIVRAPDLAFMATLVIAGAFLGAAVLHALPAPASSDTVFADPFWWSAIEQNDPADMRRRCVENQSTVDGKPMCQIALWFDAQAAEVKP